MTTMETTLTGPNGIEYAIPLHHYSDYPHEAVFFYGGAFSNFVGGPWVIESRQYETVEHFFAASKATTQQDHDIIRNMRGPWDAKRAGRRTPLREDWEDVKYDVMLTALRVKFGVTDAERSGEFRDQMEFATQLLATGNRLIAEDSPTDYVWGIRDNRQGYTGKNLLGKALMQVRNELRS